MITCSSDFPKSPPLPRFGPHAGLLYIGSFGIGKPEQIQKLFIINKIQNVEDVIENRLFWKCFLFVGKTEHNKTCSQGKENITIYS